MNIDYINLVADDFNQVKQIILSYTKSTTNSALIESITKYITFSDGKMLRPLLLLLFAKLFDFQNKDNITLAAIIELIHMATLLHDDVLDGTDLRRNKKTVNLVWGNQCAILAGDFLYSRAFQLIGQLEHNNKFQIFSLIADTANIMVEGEILQLSEKYNFSITQESYLRIISYKTAKLFATSVQLPNMVISDQLDNNVTAVQCSLDFGLNFGIFYQLLNDIEDYYKLGNDLMEGRITLPVIFVLNNLIDMRLKQQLISLIKNYASSTKSKQFEQLLLIKNIISNQGGFEYTINLAQQYLIKAKNAILVLEGSNKFNKAKFKYKQAILQMVDGLLLPNSSLFKCVNCGV